MCSGLRNVTPYTFMPIGDNENQISSEDQLVSGLSGQLVLCQFLRMSLRSEQLVSVLGELCRDFNR